MPDQGIQRRRFPRYSTSLDATVYLSSGALEARITQISRGGCLIFPALPQQTSPAVKLSFQLTPDMPSINCKAEIVYNIMDKGTGIAFTEISEYNRDLIRDYFEKQLAAEGSSSP